MEFLLQEAFAGMRFLSISTDLETLRTGLGNLVTQLWVTGLFTTNV